MEILGKGTWRAVDYRIVLFEKENEQDIHYMIEPNREEELHLLIGNPDRTQYLVREVTYRYPRYTDGREIMHDMSEDEFYEKEYIPDSNKVIKDCFLSEDSEIEQT